MRQIPDVESGRPWLNRLKRFVFTAELQGADRYAAIVTAFSPDERRRLLFRDFDGRINGDSPEDLVTKIFESESADSLLHYLLLADLQLYLPGDLLTLTDRVSMFHSLEVRVPFLDHPLLELMAHVPSELKVSGWTKKVLLKKAFSGLLPDEILYRKKLGFSVPLALWLRTDLMGLLREILSPEEVKRIGYLNYEEVERIINEHLAGRVNHESKLWALLNLVVWHRSTKTC